MVSLKFVDNNLTSFSKGRDKGENRAILYAWASLCVNMAEIADIMNLAVLDEAGLEQLSRLYRSVSSFDDTLPPSLAWGNRQSSILSPSGYAIHTQICTLSISLHRIAINYTDHRTQSPDIVEGGLRLPDFTLEASRAIINDNAIRIARLVHGLVQVHGVEHIVPSILSDICIAAIALMDHVKANQTNSPPPEKEARWLRILSNTLIAAEKHYPMAHQIRSTLSGFAQVAALENIFEDDTTKTQRQSHKFQPESEYASPSLLEHAPGGDPSAGGDLLAGFWDSQLLFPDYFAGASDSESINGFNSSHDFESGRAKMPPGACPNLSAKRTSQVTWD
jgi:hypothetical protein